MFVPEIMNSVSQRDHRLLTLIDQLLRANSSSAWAERVFSTLRLVHSKVRNRLRMGKAGKMVFIYKLLNEIYSVYNVELIHIISI